MKRTVVAALTVAALGTLAVVAPVHGAGGDFLYVENTEGGDINVIDLASHEVVSTIGADKVGLDPDDLVPSPDGRLLYVGRRNGEDLLAISTETEEVVWRLKLDGMPHHMVLAPDGRHLFIPIFIGAIMDVVDLEARAVVDRIAIGLGGHTAHLSPDGKRIYIGMLIQDRFTVVDIATRKVVNVIDTREGVRPFVITPDEKRIYTQLSKLHGFDVIDIASKRVLLTVHLPPPAPAAGPWPHTVNHGMALTADGAYLFAAASLSDYIAVYRTRDFKLVATIATGKTPGWLILGPDEKYLYASNRADDTISVISVKARKEIKRIAVGDYPQRMTIVHVPERRVPAAR